MWTIASPCSLLEAPITIMKIFPEDYFANLAFNQLIKMEKITSKKEKKNRQWKAVKGRKQRGTGTLYHAWANIFYINVLKSKVKCFFFS